MEDRRFVEPAQMTPSEASGRWGDLPALLLLSALVLALRGWALWHTEVAARDSIGYIRYALEFEKPDMTWAQVLCENHQHPGYPLTILAVSWPVRAFSGGIDAYSMQLSAQLAAGLASLLLILPMFYLGKCLGGRFVGFWGALLFQVLPVSGQILSDGLSEPLFLCMFATGLLFGLTALRTHSPWRFGLCGMFCGLAYLTRPEGAVLLLGVLALLLAGQWVSAWRCPWRRCAAGLTALTVTALAVGSIYFLATGSFSNKPAVHQIMGQGIEPVAPTPTVGPVFASIWAAFIKEKNILRGLCVLGTELIQAFHYFGILPVILGLWWNRELLRKGPDVWLMIVVSGLYSLVLFFLALKAGYISDRHVMVLVMCGSYAGVMGVRDLPIHFAAWWRSLPVTNVRPATVWSLLGMALLIGACLPKTLQPLHGNRRGHHAAGLWLAEHVKPGDLVRDDHCWAHYFAGQVFTEGKRYPASTTATCYTVIGKTRDPQAGQARADEEQRIKAAEGKLVFYWPPDRPTESAKVVVYAQPRQLAQATSH